MGIVRGGMTTSCSSVEEKCKIIIGRGNQRAQRKPQVTDKHYHINIQFYNNTKHAK
jgi:hypothetical protein